MDSFCIFDALRLLRNARKRGWTLDSASDIASFFEEVFVSPARGDRHFSPFVILAVWRIAESAVGGMTEILFLW